MYVYSNSNVAKWVPMLFKIKQSINICIAMSGFPRYGHDLNQQSQIIEALLDLSWRAIAPGHGSSRIYEGEYDFTRKQEVGEAAKKLLLH